MIKSEFEDDCLSAFIESKGIDFLYMFISEESSFNVLNEAMEIVILLIQRSTNYDRLEQLLTKEIFELCSKCAEIENEEMLNKVVEVFDLLSLRCRNEGDIEKYLELAESIELVDILNRIICNLDEDMTKRADALLMRINSEGD